MPSGNAVSSGSRPRRALQHGRMLGAGGEQLGRQRAGIRGAQQPDRLHVGRHRAPLQRERRLELVPAGTGLGRAGLRRASERVAQAGDVPPPLGCQRLAHAAAQPLVGGHQRQLDRQRAAEQLGVRRDRLLLVPAAGQQQSRAGGDQRTPGDHHQTVESRFSISSTGRV